MPELSAAPISAADLDGAEPLLEGLDFAADALANLVALARLPEDALGSPDAWGARVTCDGTDVLVAAEGGRWSISAAPGTDVADAMAVARRLHGLLGTRDGDWDLDR